MIAIERIQFPMRLRDLLGPLSVALGILLVLELSVRAVAGIGWVTLVAGNVHGFDRLQRGEDVPLEQRLYQPDRNLIFSMRPHFRTVYNRASLFPRKPTTYTVETNDRGFRTDPFLNEKPAGIFRIICLGDSSTFGMNVERSKAYPRVLAALLDERMPGRYQVLNLGVPGYTGRQGLELIRQQVVSYEPDLVTFGFGTNDRFWPVATTDDTTIRFNQSTIGGLLIAARQSLDQLYLYRFVMRMVVSGLYKLVDTGASKNNVPRRVTLEGLRDTIIAADAEIERMGATLVVLNLDFVETDAREGMRMGVAETSGAYLDLRDLFDQRRSERTRHIETEHDLPPADARSNETLWRVLAPESAAVVVEWSPFLAPTPTSDPMWDDGSHGDQVAGDGIWSLYLPLHSGRRVLYAYWQTEAGEKTREFVPGSNVGGRWRMELVPESGTMDIDDYGHYFLRTDNTHPDEAGHRLIAEALLPAVLKAERRSH